MQLPDRADVRVAGVGAPHPGRVGRHGTQLLLNLFRVLAQGDGVVVGLGHLLAVQAGHLRGRRQQRLRLAQDDAAAALEVAEQPLAVADGQILLPLQQGMRHLQRFVVALLLVAPAQVVVEAGVLLAHLLHRRRGRLLEAGLAPVDVVEAPRDLAGELDMRHLVLADRHLVGVVDEDVRALQQRVAEEPVGGQVALAQLLLLVLVARHALQPAERRHHGQQQVQLGMLGHV